MKKITMMLAVAVIFIVSAKGQSFMNLNFESAYDLPGAGSPTNNEPVSVTNALPSWTAYSGDLLPSEILSHIYYISNGFPAQSPVELEGGSPALSGNFSVDLNPDSFISQTGLVPTNAESLEFEASNPDTLQITLGGQSLSYSALFEGPAYTVYEANIPADLDGQVEALTFGIQGIGETELDNIEFNIPEPGEMSLVGLGMVLLRVFQYKSGQSAVAQKLWRTRRPVLRNDTTEGEKRKAETTTK